MFGKIKTTIILAFLIIATGCSVQKGKNKRLTDYVNPFIGTTTLWGQCRFRVQSHPQAWEGRLSGASLPNSMVQVTPVTMWRSGSGYQYEDTIIHAFVHTSKGHWNLCYVPFIAVSGNVDPKSYYTGYSHDNESASPGYYQVYLKNMILMQR